MTNFEHYSKEYIKCHRKSEFDNFICYVSEKINGVNNCANSGCYDCTTWRYAKLADEGEVEE